MKVTAAQLRQLKRDNMQWPAMLREVPPTEWSFFGRERVAARAAVWRSRAFLVQAFVEPNDMIRLSVNRTEWDERQQRYREDITWDDLQRLKAEAGYADRLAVEVFPPDALIVNVANMRHIWIMPKGAETLPFVWGGRKFVSENRQSVSGIDGAEARAA